MNHPGGNHARCENTPPRGHPSLPGTKKRHTNGFVPVECDSLDEGEFPIKAIVEKLTDPAFEFASDGKIDLVIFAVGITDGP